MLKTFLYGFSILLILNNTYAIIYSNSEDNQQITQNNQNSIINSNKKNTGNNKESLPEQIINESNTQYNNKYHVNKQKQMQMLNHNTPTNNNITALQHNMQNNNIQPLINTLLQKVSKVELEIRKNNLLLHEQQKAINKQQNIINQQKQKETAKINKVFQALKESKIIAIQHSDGTTTITDRNKLNVPRKAFVPDDPTMVPTNIITPILR